DAPRFHVDEKKRNALLWPSLGTGAHQAEYPVGVLAHCVPSLLPIDYIVIALAHRAGPQRSEVGAGARLGISLAPPILAGDDSRQEVLLLRGARERHQHRRQHPHRKRILRRRADVRPFLLENMLLDDVPAGAAEALRPHCGAPATPMQNPLPARHVILSQALAQARTPADVGGQLSLEKSAPLPPKG